MSSKNNHCDGGCSELAKMYQSEDSSFSEASTVTKPAKEYGFGLRHEQVHGAARRENLMELTVNARYPSIKHH